MRITGVVTAVLLLALAGCGHDQEPAAAPTSSAPTTTGSDTGTGLEGDYLQFVREDVPELADRTDENLINIGQAICDAVVVGETNKHSTLVALKALLDQGIAAEHAGRLLAYSALLCPEKEAALSLTS